jgi:5'-3' exonuclease
MSKLDLLQHEIECVFGIHKNEINDLEELGGSNLVYSFVIKNQKYVVKKLNDKSIMKWEQERDAYNSLKKLNITDELISYNNGIKITKFINNAKLSYGEADMIDALDQIRRIHESGVTIKYNYDIIENMDNYILHCVKNSDRLRELKNYRSKIDTIQAIINKLNIPLVLCHGDACATTNFLRLPDRSIKIREPLKTLDKT